MGAVCTQRAKSLGEAGMMSSEALINRMKKSHEGAKARLPHGAEPEGAGVYV